MTVAGVVQVVDLGVVVWLTTCGQFATLNGLGPPLQANSDL